MIEGFSPFYGTGRHRSKGPQTNMGGPPKQGGQVDSMAIRRLGVFEDICLCRTGLYGTDVRRLNHIFDWLITRVRDRLDRPRFDGSRLEPPADQPTWEVTLPWGERGLLELDPMWPTLQVSSIGLKTAARAWPVPVDLLSARDRRYLEVECRWSKPRCVVPEYLSPNRDPDRSLVEVLCRAATWMGHAQHHSTDMPRRRLDRAG